MKPCVASLYQAVELAQPIPPLMIGERCNANGSKKFRRLLLADDFAGCLRLAQEQEAAGAHLVDLCTAYAGRDEMQDLVHLVQMCARSLKAPLVLDSTRPDCIAACLRIYPGRCIINSINLEDGGEKLAAICRLVKKYGAAVIALTIDEQGMAMQAQDKLRIAQRIYELAVGQYGLRPHDLLFDPLTFTVGSGDASLQGAAQETLTALKLIKQTLPGVFTVLGISNISFGLSRPARKILNAVFLHEAVAAGLDAAIIDVAKILPLHSINAADRTVCLDLLYQRSRAADEQPPLLRFIEHFRSQEAPSASCAAPATMDGPAEEALHARVLKGDKEGVADLLSILLHRYPAPAIINNILVPAMRQVGELFGQGEILLPFVLQSAEVMKRSVAYLENYMPRTAQDQKTKILLATVQGDVHDIGKNLVDIILSNNGYEVYNLGIKVPASTIIAKAREYQVDLIGLSGLLVKSAVVMQESMRQYQKAGLNIPILLGGAALTAKFVAQACAPAYQAPVVYCQDAFAGLQAMREFEAGRLTATAYDPQRQRQTRHCATEQEEISHDHAVPTPPFWGQRQVTTIDPSAIFPYLNREALFRARWGYRRKKMDEAQYQELIRTKVEPLYARMQTRAVEEQWLQPQVSYGYFRCFSALNTLYVTAEKQTYAFEFPRRSRPPRLCIADYFKTREAGGDVVAFFVVTIGPRISQLARELFAQDQYHDYLMLHGFGVEATEALAEYWHVQIRKEWGLGQEKRAHGYVVQAPQGARYGFGYPACPALDAHSELFELLEPSKIGVSLTETLEMEPEQSTSAIIVHHPQARYFAV